MSPNQLRSLSIRVSVFLMLSLVVVAASRARGLGMHQTELHPQFAVPSAADGAIQSREMTTFFEDRIKHDPGDALLYSKLAELYLQRVRETGALEYLQLAVRAAQKSLAIVPAVRNSEGLTSLALAEFASHEFGPARDHARELAKLDYTGMPFALLGDALSELGDYREAEQAYLAMRRRAHGTDENVETRMARTAQLRGDTRGALNAFSSALQLELERSPPSPERTAWFYWQLGDTAFFAGDDTTAENSYRAALKVYPSYFRALASLGRVEAALGDLSAGIRDYEAAVALLPDPTFVAELGDLYDLAGRKSEAQREYGLVNVIGHLSRFNGVMFNRQVAMFYADHGFNVDEAYADAKREYAIRRDILGADALAWTALEAGHLKQAQLAYHAALRLGTQDPRLFYHAGMIARAARDQRLARAYLERALALNPRFDPLQAIRARAALADLPQMLTEH